MKKIIALLLIAVLFAACGGAETEIGPDVSQKSLQTDATKKNEAERIGYIPDESYRGWLILKFVAGNRIRYGDGKFTSGNSLDLSEINSLLEPYKAERLFRALSEKEYDEQKIRLEEATGREMPDLNLYFEVMIPESTAAWNLAKKLESFSFVDEAYMEARPVNPAAADTPAYNQGHLRPANAGGIDADFASGVAGGEGIGVSIVDLENAWNLNHEDLPQGINLLNGVMSVNQAEIDHGTAVAGVLVAVDDNRGVRGIVPAANLDVVSWNNQAASTAINNAANNLVAGDIMLLEGQILGPPGTGGCNANNQDGCVPLEWLNAVRAAIQTATGQGIIVVEAAGNGGNDLDNANVYGNTFNPAVNNSGAVIVGAGDSGTHAALPFSNFGARVDIQGWGHNVTTAGYGTLANLGVNRTYAAGFNGTSSASAIVTGAIAALQGVHRNITGNPATSAFLLSTLQTTGTPQAGANHIGPLPDLMNAILTLADSDGDGVIDESDNCPQNANPGQEDLDNDGFGDVCDNDADGDGLDASEEAANGSSDLDSDSDDDGLGDFDEVRNYHTDPADSDTDDDGISDGKEIELKLDPLAKDNPAIPVIISFILEDDPDRDGDGHPDYRDNCPDAFNRAQSDLDNDGIGNPCDDDIDGDGIGNEDDNCPSAKNEGQEDEDNDGTGDACEGRKWWRPDVNIWDRIIVKDQWNFSF